MPRPRRDASAPRELEVDLLLFGDRGRQSEWLTLPYQRALNRQFVMKPAADWVWLGIGAAIGELAAALATDERLTRRSGGEGRP